MNPEEDQEVRNLETNFERIVKNFSLDGKEITHDDRIILDAYWNHPIIKKRIEADYKKHLEKTWQKYPILKSTHDFEESLKEKDEFLSNIRKRLFDSNLQNLVKWKNENARIIKHYLEVIKDNLRVAKIYKDKGDEVAYKVFSKTEDLELRIKLLEYINEMIDLVVAEKQIKNKGIEKHEGANITIINHYY
jgi:hypothetical protein